MGPQGRERGDVAVVVGIVNLAGISTMRRIAFLLAAAALAGAPAALAGTLSDADNRFLADTAQGASHELAISRLAAGRATQPGVKSYAAMVVSDHQAMNAALRKLAKGKGETLPGGMSASQQADLVRLRALDGQDFDQAYVKDMVEVNRKDQADSQKEADSTEDAQVKGFIERFRSMDAKHTRMAEALQSGS